MYTLRIINKKGLQSNFQMGVWYRLMIEGSDSFKENYNQFKEAPYQGDIFAIIEAPNLPSLFPIYKDDEAYIMTESGKTFARI